MIREGAKVRQSSTSGFISFSHPDTFVLLINGIGYKLYTNQDVQNNIVRYYALNAPEVYVERRYDPNLADSNPDRFYWIVKTQDGTVYRLGYRDNSAAGQKMATCCSLASIEGHQGFDTDPSYQYSGIQWYVDMVTDVYNNQVQYIYEAWYETDNYEAYASGQWKQSAITTYHRRLKEIRYNFQGRTTGQYTWLNATPGTKVELVYTIDHRVDKIKLYHSNLSQPYRMIDLTVDTAWHDSCGQWTKTWRVTRITQQNADGSQALPPITFDYAPLAHTSGGCYIYDHLDEVHNGYGGGTRFIYGTQDGRQEPNVSSVEASYGRSYLVTQQQTWDSIHSQAAVTDYTYTKPCYNQTSGDLGDLAGAFNCPTSRHDADGPVVGFEETTVIRKNYNSATLNKTYTKFSQAMETIGRPLIHDTFSSDLIRLTRLETTYQAETVGPTSFNHPSLETLTRYVSSGQESTTKYYQYVTSQQAGVQYGQLTHVHEYDETGARKRITYYVYGANTSRWVIVPTQELTFDGSWNVKAGTFYLYDGATDPDGQSIGIGRLDSVRQRRIVPQGCPKTIETADTGYGYDVYGNVTSTTAYDDYGTVSCNSSGNWYGLSQPGQGVVKSTTATTYDSVYHLYPVVSCISQLSLCDYSNYYGFNQASISGSSGLPGQLQRRYDSNGTATAYVYVYDTFGRLDRVQAPGDAGLGDTQVSERYQYVSDGTPGQQRIISRQGRNATWQETYYDGMGRTIQVHQKADNGQEIRTTQEYDAFGRIIKSWIPYYGTHGEDGGYGTWGYVPADKSLSHTSNSYTAPEERVRTPDGYVTTTYAAGRRIITIDANGHRRDSILDALGRTIKVEEYNADPTTYEAEATGYHQTGSSNGSAWVSPAVGSGAAYLTYGPYAAPQAVGYKQAVRFRLAIDSISGNNDQIARIDVWDATAGQTLAERYLYRKDFEGGLDNFSEFVLVFDTTNRSGHSLEYRVYWQNKARMAHDRTVVSWRQASRVTQYTYDTLDHLTGIIDAGSNTTSIGYDGLGRKIQMTDPDMGCWSYDYDPRGNLAMQSDARACVIDFQYDAANRLTLKNYNTSASTCPASDPGNVNYTYDAYTSGTNYGRGHRTGMQDASGSTSWRYDVRGRMTRESKVISGQTFNTYHTYNAMDQVVTTTYPDGEAVTTGYNDAARPNTINGAVSYVSSASYSAAGQLTQQTFGNNVTTAYAYNPFSSRLTNIQTSDLLSFAYAYDKVGNLVHIDDHQDIQFSDSFEGWFRNRLTLCP